MPTIGQLRIRQHVYDLLPQYLPTRKDYLIPETLEEANRAVQDSIFLELAQRLEADPMVINDPVTGSLVVQESHKDSRRAMHTLSPKSILLMPEVVTFDYSPPPNSLRPDVKPRNPQHISRAYFGGEKWRTTMWALFELADAPTVANVDSAHIYTEDKRLAHGSDGTHRLLAAFLWGAEQIKGAEGIWIY